MSDPFDLSFTLGKPTPSARRRQPEEPFRILVLGDFGGRQLRGAPPSAAPELQEVDIDDFDGLLRRARPSAALAFGAEALDLTFERLDDFHPDALLRRIPALERLMERRRQLQDPAQLAALLARMADAPTTTAANADTAAAVAGTESEDSMFARLLGAERRTPRSPATTGLDEWLAQVVAPFVTPEQDPRVADLTASVESAAGDVLREILHHGAFRRLESTWRGLHWLLHEVAIGEELELAILDLTKPELAALLAEDDLAAGWLYRQLVDRAGAGTGRPSIVVSMHEFSASESDVLTLALMGALGAQGGFPFVATAAMSILSGGPPTDEPTRWQIDADTAARWQRLRDLPQAAHLGLVLPRFALRLPYGRATDPIDTMEFEEIPHPPRPDGYLWGDPGLAIAKLLGDAFAAQGWQLRGIAAEVAGLPLHTWREDGGRGVQPCTERLWPDRTVAAADAAGLMVLQGHANRDAARLSRLRSLSSAAAGLAGPWQS